eukprot:TRINITY_DN2350_c0_g1_i1.p1 TRINITY_DN2350_c0_g1~~TRINITY_DN2350_c0_g1_i1.p1  ORF type:complete len:375 (+),score=36.63 TRINITY_DN2350_c0_g1_i1:63-1127(+)
MTIARLLLICVAIVNAYELGTPFQMDQFGGSSENQPHATGTPNGFAVTWEGVTFYALDGTERKSWNFGGDGDISLSSTDKYTVAVRNWQNNAINCAFYDINGMPYGDTFMVSSVSTSSPSVAATPTTTLVAWTTTGTTNGTIVANLKFYTTANGNPIGSQQVVFPFPNIYSRKVVKVSGSPKAFMVSSLSSASISAQMVSPAGQLLGGQFPVNDGADADSFEVATGPKASLVVWPVTAGPLTNQIWGQFIDLNGARIGSNFRVAFDAFQPSVTATATGFQVVWVGSGGWAFSQSFGASGGAIGTEFMASHYSMNYLTGNIPLVASSNGSLLFVTSKFNGAQTTVYGRIATGLPS